MAASDNKHIAVQQLFTADNIVPTNIPLSEQKNVRHFFKIAAVPLLTSNNVFY